MDGAPAGPRPRLGRVDAARPRRLPISLIVGAVAILVAAAFVKPWGSDVGPVAVIERSIASDVPVAPRRTSDGLARPADGARLAADPDGGITPTCLNPLGWRITSSERWNDQLVRSWKATPALDASTLEVVTSSIQFVGVAAGAVPG